MGLGMFKRLGLKAIGSLGKKLGFRTLMDFIPLDASLVKGSHGRIQLKDADKAVYIGHKGIESNLSPTAIHDIILSQIFS